MHINDTHPTMLHLFALDHERLTYRYSGRDFRLMDLAAFGREGRRGAGPHVASCGRDVVDG
jgi:hypothetical protein